MTIIYPLIQEGGPGFQLSEANFAELQRVGEIALSPELQQRLSAIACFWVAGLTALQSPRPKRFRKRLKLIKETLAKAYQALDLNCEDASTWGAPLVQLGCKYRGRGSNEFF